MRMWLINPKMLCRQHLLGEHYELHVLVSNLRHSGKWARALVSGGYLEPQNALARHDKLAEEMHRRGYRHDSELSVDGLALPEGKVDVARSVRDLKGRCAECRRRMRI